MAASMRPCDYWALTRGFRRRHPRRLAPRESHGHGQRL